MSADEFTKLYTYMQGEFKYMHEQFDKFATKEEFNSLRDLVIASAKDIDDIKIELTALGNKVDRIEHWTFKIASATGVRLA